jgi:hypothetical protein
VSVDQLLAQQLNPPTLVPSLQVGLSSTLSYCDGEPCSLSRSVSWRTPTEPLYKVVDPAELFSRLMGGEVSTPEQRESMASRQSVLTAVRESASAVRSRLSQDDRIKLDEYLDSVREMERRVVAPAQCPSLGTLSLPQSRRTRSAPTPARTTRVGTP